MYGLYSGGYMREKNVIRSRIVVMMLTILALVFVAYRFSGSIEGKLEEEIQETLCYVAEQNVLALENEVEAKQKVLQGIAGEWQEYGKGDKEEIISLLKPLTDIYHFKRIGFIYPNGNAYTTDGYEGDLSFRDFFKKGMQGQADITGVMTDTLGKSEAINVFSVPVIDSLSEEVTGVLFATYRTEMFQTILSVESFGGQGYSCVIQADGTIVANMEGSPVYGSKNFFDHMQQDSQNRLVLEQVQKAMANGESGNGHYVSGGECYFHFEPLKLQIGDGQWFLVTIVPAEILTKRLDSVMHDVNLLIIIMASVLIAAFFIYVYTYRDGKRQLEKLAYQDPLTGGDNYACFKEKMKRKKEVPGYLISMDLSEFKIINSTCGVSRGNDTLAGVWSLLKENVKEQELAAHINADRFILFLTARNKEELALRVEMMREELSGLSVKLNIPQVLPYFGICPMNTEEEVEEVYSRANRAKNRIKGRRDKHYGFYEEEDYLTLLKNRQLEDEFEDAVKEHQFEVWYQPKYRTADTKIDGAEALVRWRKPDGKLVPPSDFIPLFEKNGMISVLDGYVFEEVCRQQKQWQEEGRKLFPVSVNISRATLYFPNIVERYEKVLKQYNLDVGLVQLEITESAMQDNTEIQKLIAQFHKAGFELLLDDFGNGYSSLSTLNMVHFDILKLDKGLVDHIGDANGEKLLYYTVELAKDMGLRITAEGVESKEQVIFLQKIDCHDIQGFYFSRPLPVADYELLLTA